MSSLKELNEIVSNIEITERGLFSLYKDELVIVYPFYEPRIEIKEKDNNYNITISKDYKISSYIKVESLVNSKIYLISFEEIGLNQALYSKPLLNTSLDHILTSKDLKDSSLVEKSQLLKAKYEDFKDSYSLEDVFNEFVSSLLLEIRMEYLSTNKINLNLIKDYYDYLKLQSLDKSMIYDDALSNLKKQIKNKNNTEVKDIVFDILQKYDHIN